MIGLLAVVGFLILCFYVGRFIFFDVWFGSPNQQLPRPKERYDPDYEEYKEFKKELDNSLGENQIKNHRRTL